MIEKVYIASSQGLIPQCETLAMRLEDEFDITITRKWWKHYVRDNPEFKDLTDSEFYIHPQVQFIRELDFKAVRDADLVIIISDITHKPTGSLVECGYALALGKPVIILGSIKRSSMLSSCVHVGSRSQLIKILKRDR